MAEDDPLHRRQTNAGAGEFVGAVEPLEGLKQLIDKSHIEASPVVSDEEGRLDRVEARLTQKYSRLEALISTLQQQLSTVNAFF